MKKYILNSKYILQTVGEDTVLLPCGTENEVDLSTMIVLNDTGAFIISCMENQYVSFNDLKDFMSKNYKGIAEGYEEDLSMFLDELIKKNIICLKDINE